METISDIELLQKTGAGIVVWQHGYELTRACRDVMNTFFRCGNVAVHMPVDDNHLWSFFCEALLAVYRDGYSNYAFGKSVLRSDVHFDNSMLRLRIILTRGTKRLEESLFVLRRVDQFRGTNFKIIYTIGEKDEFLSRQKCIGGAVRQLGTGVDGGISTKL